MGQDGGGQGGDESGRGPKARLIGALERDGELGEAAGGGSGTGTGRGVRVVVVVGEDDEARRLDAAGRGRAPARRKEVVDVGKGVTESCLDEGVGTNGGASM